MKFNYILIIAASLFLTIACEPMEDINKELDDSYHGPLNQDLTYELTSSDYKSISESALQDATSATEYDIASSILQGDTALTGDLAIKYIPEILASMEDMFGYAPKSVNAVTFKYRESIDDNLTDSTVTFYKYSLYSWMLLPDPGYEYDFEDGTAYEDIDMNGWTQYNLGTATDMNYTYRTFSGNTYAYVTAYNGESENGGYDIWLVSPGLDLNNIIVAPNLSFDNANAYPNGATFKVFIMDNADPSLATFKDEITEAEIATSEENNYDFISSGEIDLSAYSGIVYIGFEYIAETGQTTSFCIDNFLFDYLELD